MPKIKISIIISLPTSSFLQMIALVLTTDALCFDGNTDLGTIFTLGSAVSPARSRIYL